VGIEMLLETGEFELLNDSEVAERPA